MGDWPYQELSKKVLETIERGISGMARPWQWSRTETTRISISRKEALVAAQTKVDVEKILAGELVLDEQGNLAPKPDAGMPPDKLPNLANSHQPLSNEMIEQISITDGAARQHQKYENLYKISEYAQEEAEHIGDIGMEEADVEPDWFNRWRSYAEDTSREELQRLWARVLASEVKRPNSCSFRTLQFISTMTKQDAQLIEKLAEFVINGQLFFPKYQKYYTSRGLLVVEALRLVEIGILAPSSGVGGPSLDLFTVPQGGHPHSIFVLNNSRGLLVVYSDKHSVNFSIQSVSEIGRELMRMLNVQSHDGLLKLIASDMQNDKVVSAVIGRYDPQSETFHDMEPISL